MKYPELKNTPIKEIIFSISYNEIVDKDCFDKFINLEFVKNNFKEISPSVTNEFQISKTGVKILKNNSGFHLKNKNNVLQMRKGSLSFHHLNKYCDYNEILDNLMNYWMAFDKITKDNLTVTNISVRYINVLETDENNTASELIQLYPRQSINRKILNFQNSVNFSYIKYPEYLINAVSTKPKNDLVLLDISVNHKMQNTNHKEINLKDSFKPLRKIKNKVFFDSITAKALLKYII